ALGPSPDRGRRGRGEEDVGSRRAMSRRAVALIATLMLAGCGPVTGLGLVGAVVASSGGGGGGGSSGTPSPPLASATIGPSGGTLQATDGQVRGASVTVPPGALASSTTIE